MGWANFRFLLARSGKKDRVKVVQEVLGLLEPVVVVVDGKNVPEEASDEGYN